MTKKANIHKSKQTMRLSVSLWQRIRRTPYQAFASVFMISITLFVLSVFLLLAATSSSVLSYFETKPQITVFFKENQDKPAVDALVEKLKATGKMASYKYISKEDALKIYQEQNKDDPLLLEMVTADILPASLEISATNPSYLVEIAEIVKKEPGIDEVVFQKEIVDTLISWTSTIRKIGAVFILFLLSASFMILITNISMKIVNRKDEIVILRLVGATSWYIKRPFVLEGILYGIIGATISWLVTSAIVLYLQPFMASFLHGISSLSFWKVTEELVIYLWPPNIAFFLLLWIVLVAAGFSIGLIGSLFAVSRYMR